MKDNPNVRMNSAPPSDGMDPPIRETTTRGSLMNERMTIHAYETDAIATESKKDYKGRITTWPGIILLICILLGGIFSITYFAIETKQNAKDRAEEVMKRTQANKKIQGGDNADAGGDITENGEIGNPNSYPASTCVLPNYVSKNGKMYAVGPNNEEIAVDIKGVNWSVAIPLGLWDNQENGTTAYEIAAFLARNKFNSVRLPVSIMNIVNNVKPNQNLINKVTNKAITATTYMSLLQSLTKALAFRNISILISLHTLTPADRGDLWYSGEVPESTFLTAVDILSKNLCNNDYWNIIGLDLKNEPATATWGDGSASDFKEGATRIGNRMLKGCPNWLAFVEGINGNNQVTISGQAFTYYDWWGGGLQKAGKDPVVLSVNNKIVYAPHYYTPAVFPQTYLYDGNNELSDEMLMTRIKGTLDDMFGYLASETGPAIVLGEFGGLYSTDLHPKKTIQRCVDNTIQLIMRPGFSGGYVWSLNPESAYEYNPFKTTGHFVEGLLEPTWLKANDQYLKSMAGLDALKNLRMFPCIKKSK